MDDAPIDGPGGSSERGSTIHTLRDARALIADPARWTQHALARNADGDRTEVDLACEWCALGAMYRVRASEDAVNALDAAARRMGYRSAQDLNDATNHATVLIMFDEAIECDSAK